MREQQLFPDWPHGPSPAKRGTFDRAVQEVLDALWPVAHLGRGVIEKVLDEVARRAGVADDRQTGGRRA